MSTKINAENAKADAENIMKVWIPNPDFKLRDVTLEELQHDHAALEKVLADLQAKEDETTPLRNLRDDLALKVNATCTRARAGIKGYFGDNSSEYELAGGTRSSERQRGGPKSAAKTAAAPAK